MVFIRESLFAKWKTYPSRQEFRPRFRTMRRLHDLHMNLFEDQEARELFKIYGDKSWS